MEYRHERSERKRDLLIKRLLSSAIVALFAIILWLMFREDEPVKSEPCNVTIINNISQGCSVCGGDKKLPSFVKRSKKKGKHTECSPMGTPDKTVNTVPEPGTVVLLGVGLATLVLLRTKT